jgi:hypothetical protein
MRHRLPASRLWLSILCVTAAAYTQRLCAQDADAPKADATSQSGWPVPRIGGLIQVDSTLFHQSSFDEVDPGTALSQNENRFELRRARLTTEIQRGFFRAFASFEANSLSSPPLRVQAAEVALRYPLDSDTPQLLAAGGLFLIPFGFSVLEPDNERLFFEPSVWVNAFFPGRRDLGARIEGQYRFLHGTVAVMNGEPSLSAFPVHDPNAAKDVVARVTASGTVARAVKVSAGGSLLLGTGFHRGRRQTKDTLVWRDDNEDGVVQSAEIQAIAGSAAEASRNFARFGIGADILVSAQLPLLGQLDVMGEIVFGKNLDRGVLPADPWSVGRSLRELGYVLSVTQQVTRHAEVGVRYDYYDPDFDANEREGVALVPIDAAYGTVAISAAWRTFDPGRIVLEYDHRRNALGRDQNGTPTTLAADSFSARIQLAF